MKRGEENGGEECIAVPGLTNCTLYASVKMGGVALYTIFCLYIQKNQDWSFKDKIRNGAEFDNERDINSNM